MILSVKYIEVYKKSNCFALICTFFRCKWRSKLVSITILRCFWVENDLTKFWLKSKGEWLILLTFLLKMTSWASLLGSGLKFIFHWKAQSLIILKLFYKFIFVEVILWKIEKRDVLAANNFGFGS